MKPVQKVRGKSKPGRRRRVVLALVKAAAGAVALLFVVMLGLRWIDPPITTVQMQRQVEAWVGRKPYQRKYSPVSLQEISPQLQHAVVAAEDARFYGHHGIDFKELEKAIDEAADDDDRGPRGASTITQQLVKNLFMTTHRSWIRKGVEFVLAPVADVMWGKQRVLELYLNVVEWGPGVYGAQAAAQHHYGVSARALSREQAARLAAVLPAPLRRRPARMNSYSAKIQVRMRQMGW